MESDLIQKQAIEGFRLSPQQRRVWLLQQQGKVFGAQCTILVEGILNPDVLKNAVQNVIARHEILRTSYHSEPGIKFPFQVVADNPDFHWAYQDWSAVDSSQAEARMDQFLQEQDGLESLRFWLFDLSENRHVLAMLLPSLCADSDTIDKIVREIAQSYGALLSPEELHGDLLQYADYCAWKEELLAATDATRLGAGEYWKKLQEWPKSQVTLPFQYRSVEGTPPAAQPPALWVIPDTVAAIDSIARAQGVTAADVLCAAWTVLLATLTGQNEIIMTGEFAPKESGELRNALGLFAQWLPVRCQLSETDPFTRIVARVAEEAREGHKWQDYFVPDEGDLAWDQIGIGFSYEERLPKVTVHGVSFSIQQKRVSTGRYDVRLCCIKSANSIAAELQYNPGLFAVEDIERFAGQFLTLLNSATRNPDHAIGKLEILSPREREQILGFNDARHPSPVGQRLREGRIEEWFHKEAGKRPDNIAVVFEDAHLTYRELEDRANQVAEYLQSVGVTSDTLVAICVERSLDMIVGLLGVLKAGGAYVPLDPALPRERLGVLLEEIRTPVVLTQRRLVDNLVDLHEHVVALDGPICPKEGGRKVQHEGASDADLAYVLFTSGSTGKPKGVGVEHRQLTNYVEAILERLELPAGASYAHISAFAADLGNTAIFPALCSGGSLHILSQERASDPEALSEYFRRHPIDCLKIVPSHLQAMLTAAHPELVLPKQRLVLGGETVSWDLVSKVQRFAPNCIVLNHYGPTEATIGTTTHRVLNMTDKRCMSVPIGRPLAHARVHLLNSQMQPVPIWVPGEIYIGGMGLARGYLNRPDQTAERFVPSPFHSGMRLYRTGDLGRYLPDGSIEFLGRTDHQVKIRGFRVELGEIEFVLRQHARVRQAVVIVREDNPGEKRLTAYVVLEKSQTASRSELREFLKARLPGYMVPAEFVVLDELPLTSNGKLDRSRLPAPAGSDAAIDKLTSDRRTPLELVLARIFASVLGTSENIEGNFFDLGGHSLMAIQVLSRVRQLLLVDVPVRVFFEKPTISGLASEILADTANAARIERVAQQVLTAPPAKGTEPIAPKGRNSAPLSPTQEQMWFIDQLVPGSASYNMAHAFRISGPLRIAAVEQSLNEIVRRHEALRSTFASIDGVPQQVIAPSLNIVLRVVEVPGAAGSERAEKALRLATEEARLAFDLSKGPLLQSSIFKLEEEVHVLLITMHHIISDGWSWGVFLKELSELYAAFSVDRLSPLADLPIQYADFVHWQFQNLKEDVLEERLSYWTRQLKNAPALLELPTDYPRPAVQSFRGATHSETFSLELKDKLGALSRAEGATLFMTVCAAFNALLFRWTGQEDIVVGSTIAGRNRAELEPLIGLFINTLVLRTDMSGNPTFRDLLGRMREVALGAYANQEVPFEKLMERQHSKRSLSHGTLFQVLFVLHQGTSQHDLKLPGLTVTKVPVEMGTVKFALSVSMVDKPEGLNCSFTYQTDLFEAKTIERMMQQFRAILSGVVRDPDTRLSNLPILSETQGLEILVRWNDTQKKYPQDKCVHELFEEQVKRTPDATAVLFERERLSYRELDRKANQLAHYLQKVGVYPGVLVVVCMDRSLEMVISLLAVLKAGGAYVPLDPKYSRERLSWVLEDTEAPILLTEPRIAEIVGGELSRRVEIICVRREKGDLSDDLGRSDFSAMPRSATPDSLAYVIYTSGSTGTPKGVEVTHKAVVNFTLSSAATFDLQPTDRFLQFASLSFDTAIEEIFPCLSRGATLILRTDRMLESPGQFLQQCSEWGITILDLPTAYWHELTENISAENLALPEKLRLVILGGEKALPERVANWNSCSKGRLRLLNEYGPTEATVVATTHDLSEFVQPPHMPPREVPIGRPISNVQTYVLDRYLNPVPVGVGGELFIGGAGLARGYRKRPDLTAESFIPNPFSHVPGERLYKTGDRVRYLPDGTLEFLGRADHQVKIRGFRVEPGEVETVLTENVQVRQVCIVARKDVTGNNRLVAYIVPVPGSSVTAPELRDFLRSRLPDYMVPSAFVLLDALPLMASGKVDRNALPEPDELRFEAEQSFLAARTAVEQALTDEWERLLSVGKIGVRDNFFDLGGHSLLAVRLIARIEKRFGKNLPVAVLFQSPTIEQLAVMLGQEQWPQSWSSLIPIRTQGSRPPFFWAHGDSSNTALPVYLNHEQPLYGLEHQGHDGRPAAYTTVETIAKHYLRELRLVCPRGPYLLGGYSFGAVVAFEMAQQLTTDREEVALLFMLDPPGKVLEVKTSPSLREELRRHWETLASLSPLEKLKYVAPRVKEIALEKMTAWIPDLKKLRCKAHIAFGYLLPPSLRSGYILDIYRQALPSYVPQPYSGRVLLFKEEGRSYQNRLDWVKLNTGELEIHEGSGEHMDWRNEPYVRQWAQRLRDSLDLALEPSGSTPARRLRN